MVEAAEAEGADVVMALEDASSNSCWNLEPRSGSGSGR
jgi:hypothetical protein